VANETRRARICAVAYYISTGEVFNADTWIIGYRLALTNAMITRPKIACFKDERLR
jgi:hypothetical protein